ncbi:MAG: hypothetical protein D6702_02180 [Planctomycetota bacterium]|nr:MAG: hypothetical protein D6702_02180 [Planctomycetota bacterium]
MICALLSLLVLCPPQAAAGPEDVLLKLRDGRIVLGRIADHDFDGLSVVRTLDGARFRLSWSDLFPGEAEELKAGFGYKIDTAVPEVEADRLLLVNGRSLTGRILRSDPDTIELRTRNAVTLVPRARLAAPPEKVRVPADEVLTPEQFYQERLPDVPEGDAAARLRFALELQAVFALERAREQLDLAEELAAGDAGLHARIEAARTSIGLSLANRDQAELLEEVRQLMNRERFVEAEAKLAEFGERFPDSDLKGEWLELKDRFAERRRAGLERFLVRRWFTVASTLLKERALDRQASVDELLEWAGNELPRLVRERLAAEMEEMAGTIDPSELDALWAERTEQGARRHQASYGNGTWILGEDKARAGLVAEEESQDDGKTAAQREIEERTRRYLENLERQRRRQSGEDEVTPEDWWRQAKASQRFQFLLAYYAEFSGDFEVTNVSFAYCPTCGGQGWLARIELGNQGGRQRRVPCPTCHKIQVQRSVTFR